MKLMRNRAGFTLLELLIVIGILAVLATIAILVINPAEHLASTRDSRRLSEFQELNQALMMYQTSGGTSLGSLNTVYVSLPSSQSNCSDLGLPSLPTGWFYQCSNSANYKKVDGSGWIPVNFTQISFGSPFSVLPVDPTNQAQDGLYYTYVPGASWKLTSYLESERYAKTMADDGGPDTGLYETGTNLNLANFQRGLVGYWKFDEGSGTLYDSSGYGNNGTQSGGVTYGATGKVGNALSFDGTDDKVQALHSTSLNFFRPITALVWIYPTVETSIYRGIVGKGDHYNGWAGWLFRINSANKLEYCSLGPNLCIAGNAVIANDIWQYVVLTQDASGLTKFYINGILDRETTYSNPTEILGIYELKIGTNYRDTTPFEEVFRGTSDEVRIYNRALSAAEISAIYNATK